MNRTLWLAFLSLVLTFCPNAAIEAGSIVYNIQNYADLQNGYTLSGTITTDGTIGTLTSDNITAWSVSVTGPTDYSVNSQTIEAFTVILNLIATTTELLLPPPTVFRQAIFGTNDQAIETVLSYSRDSNESLDLYTFKGNGTNGAVWSDAGTSPPFGPGLQLGGGDTWVIATASAAVPEPGTLTLASLGVACFAVAQAMIRFRKNSNIHSDGR